MPIIHTPPGQGLGNIYHIKTTYSFAVHGGTIGTITLAAGVIPNGAAILAAYIEVNTIPVGATATIALTTGQAADDIQVAAGVGVAPWSTTGWKLSSARTFATAPLEATADRSIQAVIATANLTAGAFDVHLFYIVPA